MSTYWFQRRSSELASVSEDDDRMVLVGDLASSDWVRLPPELGGLQLRVLSNHDAECPQCHAPQRRHLVLEDGYGVAECSPCGYLWYRLEK